MGSRQRGKSDAGQEHTSNRKPKPERVTVSECHRPEQKHWRIKHEKKPNQLIKKTADSKSEGVHQRVAPWKKNAPQRQGILPPPEKEKESQRPEGTDLGKGLMPTRGKKITKEGFLSQKKRIRPLGEKVHLRKTVLLGCIEYLHAPVTKLGEDRNIKREG